MTPGVSIVLPAYNSERYLMETLDSVLRQTYRDFECIVVDDGSTDRTPAILANYAAADARIRVFRQAENCGEVAACNLGTSVARAELLAVMDHDDIALPDRLEKQVAFLSSHADVAAVGSAVQIIDGAGVVGRTKSFPTVPGLVAWSMLFFNSMAHPTVMFRTSALQALGGYQRDAKAAEDYQLLMKLGWQARLANLPHILLRYRRWGGNASTHRWQEQQASSNRVVQAHILEVADLHVTLEDAAALRGLATDNYPTAAGKISRIADLIETLVPVYLRQVVRTEDDRQAILLHAGIRLCMLAALATPRSLPLAARLAKRAARLSPWSGLAFAAKAGRRLLLPQSRR